LKKQVDQKTRKKHETLDKERFNDQMAREMLNKEDEKFSS